MGGGSDNELETNFISMQARCLSAAQAGFPCRPGEGGGRGRAGGRGPAIVRPWAPALDASPLRLPPPRPGPWAPPGPCGPPRVFSPAGGALASPPSSPPPSSQPASPNGHCVLPNGELDLGRAELAGTGGEGRLGKEGPRHPEPPNGSAGAPRVPAGSAPTGHTHVPRGTGAGCRWGPLPLASSGLGAARRDNSGPEPPFLPRVRKGGGGGHGADGRDPSHGSGGGGVSTPRPHPLFAAFPRGAAAGGAGEREAGTKFLNGGTGATSSSCRLPPLGARSRDTGRPALSSPPRSPVSGRSGEPSPPHPPGLEEGRGPPKSAGAPSASPWGRWLTEAVQPPREGKAETRFGGTGRGEARGGGGLGGLGCLLQGGWGCRARPLPPRGPLLLLLAPPSGGHSLHLSVRFRGALGSRCSCSREAIPPSSPRTGQCPNAAREGRQGGPPQRRGAVCSPLPTSPLPRPSLPSPQAFGDGEGGTRSAGLGRGEGRSQRPERGSHGTERPESRPRRPCPRAGRWGGGWGPPGSRSGEKPLPPGRAAGGRRFCFISCF